MRPDTLSWPGGENSFALPLGELRALQTHLSAGPQEIYNRVTQGEWRIDDLMQVIRLGLIGGGMTNAEAGPMVERLFTTTPLLEFVPVAQAIMALALIGPADDVPGKPVGAMTETPPENGNSPPSTETAL